MVYLLHVMIMVSVDGVLATRYDNGQCCWCTCHLLHVMITVSVDGVPATRDDNGQC